MISNPLVRFDYGQLKPEDKQFLHAAETKIKRLVTDTAIQIVEIGVTLIRAKERLLHGQFEAWAKAELPWSLSSTKRFCYVGEAFAQHNVENFQPSALYVLAWPNVPPQAREYALELVNDGEVITHESAKEILSMYRPAALPPGMPEVKVFLRDEPVRESETNVLRDATSWRHLRKAMEHHGTLHIARVDDTDSSDTTYQATGYPLDESCGLVSIVRRGLDELIAAIAGEETLKRCKRCGRDLPRDQFSADSAANDRKTRYCKQCEKVRAKGRVRKDRAKSVA